ncbi:MAG: hypothetical protein M3N68_05805, partial [Actinomycetota bacterium]|nr:hypothetical protein [Actinomycetota bacterium]
PEASAPAAAVAPSTVPAPTPPGPPEPEPPTSSEQAATGASETQDAAAAPPPPAVDELFARIRAGHQNGGSNELQVLAEEAPTNGHDRTAEAPTAPADSAPEPSVTDQDELLLQRRDALLEGVQTRLTRKLKRALQDEQNQVLDRLRSARRMPAAVSLLPSPQEQASPYAAAGLELLEEAVAAAATFASMEEVPNVDVADLAAELSEALARPLRRHLEQGIDRADHEDRDVVVERIGAAYRECKTQRCERLAADAVIAAFSRGTTAALAGGPPLRWVVDDEDGPCPDCDDNALAGPTPSGVAYPTGQLHPPAHAGCRCLLVQTTT